MAALEVEVVNLTKSALELRDATGRTVVIQPDPRHVGLVSIGEHRSIRLASGAELPLNVQYVSEVRGLPEPSEGTVYVVPVEMAMALQRERDDVFFAAEELVASDEGATRPVRHLRRIVSQLNA